MVYKLFLKTNALKSYLIISNYRQIWLQINEWTLLYQVDDWTAEGVIIATNAVEFNHTVRIVEPLESDHCSKTSMFWN